MLKRISCLLLAVILMVPCLSFGASATPNVDLKDVGDHSFGEVEPNYSPTLADVIYNDYTVSGTMTGNDLDCFYFYLPYEAIVTVICVAERSETVMLLEDAYENAVAISVDNGASDSYYADVLYERLPAGGYYLYLLNYNNPYITSNGYTFYLEYTAAGGGHTHSYSTTIIPATCTTGGYTEYYCSCGNSYVGDETPALGHSYGNYVSDDNATCTEDGTESAICSRCGERTVRDDVDTALGHSFVDYVSNGDATCTADGTKTAKCSRCNQTQTVTDPDSALGHSFTNYVSNNDATYTQDGTKTAKCDRCTATHTVADPGSMLIPNVQGKCGTNLSWSLNNGILKITGSGAMYNYTYDFDTKVSDAPWTEYILSVKEIQIGSGATSIGSWAFRGMSNLKKITIPSTVTSIGSSAFWLCSSLTTVTLPSSIRTIGGSAFYKCTALTKLVIPEGVTAINGNLCYQNTAMTSVTIPKSVKSVANNAFRGCSKLQTVNYKGSQANWDAITMGTGNEKLTEATLKCRYEIRFVNYNGTVLSSKLYDLGNTVTPPANPSRPSDGMYKYTFTGWSPSITTVRGDATYTAKYSKQAIQQAAITQQPTSVNADSGDTVQFKVSTTGVVASYQWQYRKLYKWFNTSMSGYNTNTLIVSTTGARNGYDYRCKITFVDGTVLYSEPAELTVNTYIVDVTNPTNQTMALGYKAQFTASASGESIKYQWQYCRPGSTKWIDTSMEGANKPTVLIETTTTRNGYQYRCAITDVTGQTVYTEAATMRVLSITSQPANVTATSDATVTFSIGTSVPNGFTYQWQYRRSATGSWNNTTLAGCTTGTLVVPAQGKNGYEYRCILTGAKNSKLESQPAKLTVTAAQPDTPVTPEEPTETVKITGQPKNTSVLLGENVKYTVKATGAKSYRWQYRRNETASWTNTTMTGYNTATLTVNATAARNGYQYRCVVTGADGTKVNSGAAALKVIEITEQTVTGYGVVGTNTKFKVVLSNTDGVKYQWKYSKDGSKWYDTGMTGYNTATLTVGVTEARNGYEYKCVITDGQGNTVETEAATLCVVELAGQPKNKTVTAGKKATFSVSLSDVEAPVSYQWQYTKNGTKWYDTGMTGYNTDTLTVDATAARNGYVYRCVVTLENGGTLISESAVLTVK